MEDYYEGRKPNHQDGGLPWTQAGHAALDTSSRPMNQHPDPCALDQERKRNQKNRCTGLPGEGHLLDSDAAYERLDFAVHFLLQTKVARREPTERSTFLWPFVTCQNTDTPPGAVLGDCA